MEGREYGEKDLNNRGGLETDGEMNTTESVKKQEHCFHSAVNVTPINDQTEILLPHT